WPEVGRRLPLNAPTLPPAESCCSPPRALDRRGGRVPGVRTAPRRPEPRYGPSFPADLAEQRHRPLGHRWVPMVRLVAGLHEHGRAAAVVLAVVDVVRE